MEVLEKIKNIKDINFEKQNEFQSKMNNIMKPIKSLGVLEKIGAQIAGIKGNTKYSLKNRKHFVFASDNGVEKEGVSPCPREYTRLVSESMLGGTGAIRLLCNTYNVDFSLVDVGIDGDIKKEYENLIINKISKGTGNIRYEKAMELEAVYKVLDSSFKIVEKHFFQKFCLDRKSPTLQQHFKLLLNTLKQLNQIFRHNAHFGK